MDFLNLSFILANGSHSFPYSLWAVAACMVIASLFAACVLVALLGTFCNIRNLRFLHKVYLIYSLICYSLLPRTWKEVEKNETFTNRS